MDKRSLRFKKYAFVADYIRFYALYNYGGIYLDMDVEVKKSFNSILDTHSFIGFEYMGVPEAAIIGAEKNIKWVKICLDYYINRHFILNANMKQGVIALPINMKALLDKYFGTDIFDTDEIQYLDEITLYPYWYFSPKDQYRGTINEHPDTYCIHHFNNSWIKKSRKKLIQKIHIFLDTILGRKRYGRLLYEYYLDKIHQDT